MIYIIFGDEKFLVNRKLDKILKENKDSSIIKFDAYSSDFNINDISFACKNIDLFSNKNLVLVKDPLFLIKKIETANTKDLIDYCKNPIYDSDLVFYSINYNFNERLNIFKDIKSNAQVFRFDKIDNKNYTQYAAGLLNEYKLNITNDAKSYLIGNPNMSFDILHNNLEILSLYPDKIDIDVVKGMIIYPDEEYIFNLINAIVEKDISSSIKYARNIIKLSKDVDPIPGLISLIANKVRFIYNVSYYDSIGKNKNEIMQILNQKYLTGINKAFDSLNHFNQTDLLKLLDRLSDLDIKIKSNNSISEKENLELFILGLTNEEN